MTTWFNTQSHFIENHYDKTKPSMAFYDDKLQEHHSVSLDKSKNNKLYYTSDKFIYNDSNTENKLVYSNYAKAPTRYCDKYQIIKNTSSNSDGINKIEWDYATDKSYGISVQKEKIDGKWVAKIYQKCNYSHPEDHALFDVYQNEHAINPNSEFCKAFNKDVLIFDSTKHYSEEQVKKLLTQFELPTKAINIIKKAIRVY